MTIKPELGDKVYLFPTLPNAPTASYTMPLVLVKKIVGILVTVQLPDGSESTTDVRNLRRTLPADRDAKPKSRPELPEGFEEISLF